MFAGGKLNLLKKCYTRLQELEGMHMHHIQHNQYVPLLAV